MTHDEETRHQEQRTLKAWQRPFLKRLATPDADNNESPGGDGFSQDS